MTGAGQMSRRLVFARRAGGDDGMGNRALQFIDQFTLWARVRPLKGGEAVMGDRLQGVQPVVITVHASSLSRRIGADWQARDAHSGAVYAITSPPVNMDEKSAHLEMLASAGPAS